MKIDFKRLLAGAATLAIGMTGWQTGTASAASASCLATTKVNTFVAIGSPFGGGTTLSWNVTPGCPGVAVVLLGGVGENGSVGANGKVVKNPATTTEYRLFATTGTLLTKQLGSQVVLAGKSIGYKMTYGLQSFPASGAEGEAANAIANKITRSFSDVTKRTFLGRALEVHIIPVNMKLTQLPPWANLTGTTCGNDPTCVADRNWSDVRGYGGTPIGTDRLAIAVGAEQLVAVANNPWKNTHRLGHVLAHELGHVPHQLAAEPLKNAVRHALIVRKATGGEFIGNEDYTRSSPEEYWAEGTAALFNYPISDLGEHPEEFTGYWLKQNDPTLFKLLSTVYQGVLICNPSGFCSL
ncbi:hypothetical protein Acor_75330 [Acrocarpospora corrugata]|uniref:Uncharacterized protein n=1 Tax=Acrocarpospora corrugata TaxID=35763 RepID=A0A5M3W8R9_9ACTN|nr:hypothetical protein [Acrocarpospora corrugata]GES05465.1 hypothetical protein Acor_75330 [Acrocarpospora corrugata]